MPVDFYELLGVERDAETAEIKQAFRQRAREYHPDVNDDERATAQFTVVRKAYEVLTDDAERADYDRMGHGTYVEKRLDGLTKFRYPGKADEQAGSSGSGSADAGGRSGSSGSSTGRSSSSTSSSSSSSGRSSSSSSSGRSSGRASSSSSTASSSRSGRSRHSGSASSSRASGSSSRTTGASQSSAASGASRGRTRNTQSSRTGTNGRFERERDGSESASASASGGTNPLWFGWGVSLGALLAYLGGLAWHLSGDGAGFVTALASLDTAAPAAALLASSPLSVPSVAALQTAAATPTVVVLPVAAALLAVSVAGVIARFGHAWTTWVYALAAAVPLALVVAGAVGVGRPVAVDLLGFVVCPLLGAGGFVVDAGWYLFASR
ncbi:J domain-containing protein [Haloferax volcanii]|uniref:DnaJ N-terminal domain protein n=2 Tax=Haloferax volcanii TaxID=2246 RepID=D4GVL6_HALVD|nr:DnaJ domain-containing protein [Haloferax volcanii]ADE03913.1 DnaJ N-terminal domain protein [Haloferax volcanii DS2]MBS8119624.1 DnaJ domain-containing protein [Haloferax volcanii]MBS8124636.1 DnaJ domain-containing protein [Haloferax volcanii]MBS8128699.1 DnaJ domain-containing protein [Haloferax volcanii]MBS8132564.1 DnaJ domain-containing protein [Haloferax volcanii]